MPEIKVCGDNSYPPFEFTQENGIFNGFDVDILSSIALETGINIRFMPEHWNDAIQFVKAGKYDAIQGISFNNDRLRYFDFTHRYLSVYHSLFALKSNTKLNLVEDVLSNEIAVQKGDVCYDLLKKRFFKNKPMHIIMVNNQEIALKKLFDEQVQAIAGNNLTISYLADKMNAKHLLKVIGDPLKVTDYCIAVKRGNTELLDIFNKGINAISENGSYKVIYQKWFGKEIGSVDSQIIESVKTGVMCINQLGEITAVNNRACEILSLPKNQLLTRSVFNSPLNDIVDYTLVQETLSIGNPFSKEISHLSKNTEQKYFTVNGSPLLDMQNHVLGAVLNFRDITNEKKMENILITRDKMKSIGFLLLTLVHEIRNPLTSIKNFIDMIPVHLEDAEFRESLLSHVPKQINIIDDLLKKILEYSKPKKPIVKKLNVKLIIDSIIQRIYKEESIKIIVKLPVDFYVKADEFHLRQIIFNVLLNSIEALRGSGIIQIEGLEELDKKIITITDNGTGISEEEMPHLFEPFYTTKEEGTGLGLYIVQQLLKENNCRIDIKSDKTGTQMILFFPI